MYTKPLQSTCCAWYLHAFRGGPCRFPAYRDYPVVMLSHLSRARSRCSFFFFRFVTRQHNRTPSSTCASIIILRRRSPASPTYKVILIPDRTGMALLSPDPPW